MGSAPHGCTAACEAVDTNVKQFTLLCQAVSWHCQVCSTPNERALLLEQCCCRVRDI